MLLATKLSNTPPEETVVELEKIIPFAQLRNHWFHGEVVWAPGYVHSIPLTKFVFFYLQSSPFQEHHTASLKERLDCFKLWGRVKKLALSLGSVSKKASSLTFNGKNPLEIITNPLSPEKDYPLMFDKPTFKLYWNEKSTSKAPVYRKIDGKVQEMWLVTPQLLERTLSSLPKINAIDA